MIYELKNVNKSYGNELVLKNINFNIEESSITTILGPSGSGKSTILNLIGGIDNPSSGEIIFNNEDISNYSIKELTNFRYLNIAFIFQSYNLISNLTVHENICLGSYLNPNELNIEDIMEILDIKRHEHKFIYQLSGGEQQRVCIARSLIKNPRVLICDEPTGALDEKIGKEVLKKIVEINEKYHTTIVMVSHNPNVALLGDKIIKINSGEISEIITNKKRKKVDEISWA